MVDSSWGGIVNKYVSPAVKPTILGERPSGAVDVIDHFSKPLIIRKYINPIGFDIKDGLNKKGGYVTETLWCVLRPISSGLNGINGVNSIGGKDLKSEWWLYYNPFHKAHGLGKHLQIAAKSNNTDYSGFSDEIEYQGEVYAVTSLKKIDAYNFEQGSETEFQDGGEKYIGKCHIKRVGNTNHLSDSGSNERDMPTSSHYGLT